MDKMLTPDGRYYITMDKAEDGMYSVRGEMTELGRLEMELHQKRFEMIDRQAKAWLDHYNQLEDEPKKPKPILQRIKNYFNL